MRTRTLAGMSLVVSLLLITTNAYASNKVTKFDYSKSLSRTLSCPGVSIPITYELAKPIASGSSLSIDLYHQGKFEQTITLKGASGGMIKNMSWGGRDWYGTSSGNPTSREWYIYPIKDAPEEMCAQFKSDIQFAKSKYTAYKALIAILIPRSA
jgi:hypothetical protein